MVTIDLLSVRFLDSSGISAFIELHRRTDANHVGVRLVDVHDTQRQILDIVGLASTSSWNSQTMTTSR